MLESCQQSCKLCTRYYDATPPMFTSLWNGLLVRTVGFGTAGLGSDTEEAVVKALEAGYTHIDSAQGKAWYREDETGKVLLSQLLRNSTGLIECYCVLANSSVI
jgi:hypothetical protein